MIRGLAGLASLLTLSACSASADDEPARAVAAAALTGGARWIDTLYGPDGAHAPNTLSALAGSEGEIVAVGGRTTQEDGAGGLFQWVAGYSPIASDDGTTSDRVGGIYVIPGPEVVPPGTGYWRRVFRGRVNVAWLGAGLQPTSSSAGARDTLAFEYALARYQSVYAPAGKYQIVRPLRLPLGVHLAGDGAATILTYAPKVDESERGALDAEYNPAEAAADGVIEHLTLRAGNAQAWVGIRLFGAFRFTLRNVYVDGCDIGFRRGGVRITGLGLVNSAAIDVRSCHIQRCFTNFYTTSKGLVGSAIVLDGAAPGAISVDGGTRLQGNSGWGIQCTLDPAAGGGPTTAALTVSDCVIEGNGGGIGGAVGPCVIRGTHFEQHAFAPHIDISALARVSLGASSSTTLGIERAMVNGLVVEGNKFVSFGGRVHDACHIRIVPTAFGGGAVSVRGNYMSGATRAGAILGLIEGIQYGPNSEISSAAQSVLVYSTSTEQARINGFCLATPAGLVPASPTVLVPVFVGKTLYECSQNDQVVLVDATTDQTVVLPDPTFEHPTGGRTLTIKRVAGAGRLSIRPASGSLHAPGAASIENLGAGEELTLPRPFEWVTLVFGRGDGSFAKRWFIVARGSTP